LSSLLRLTDRSVRIDDVIDFQTDPARYRHWRLRVEPPIAYLDMDVDPGGGLHEGYEMKLNSYDLGVDIELADAVQRLRFEHPEVGAVLIGSLNDRVFCAGANIGMLASAAHPLKVNFCKFTNETRNAIEDATANSGQRYLAALKGNAAGGGYELALATDHIMLVDDGSSSVALPEVPLLGVLPGTGGLTRLVDKRHVRRDRADVFCTVEEGIKGKRALEWRLVDELVPSSTFEETTRARALEMASASDRTTTTPGVELTPIQRVIDDAGLAYSTLRVEIDRVGRTATLVIKGPDGPDTEGVDFWPLRLARELDDAVLHLRVNELEIGTLILRSEGDGSLVESYDRLLVEPEGDWFRREVALYWKRLLKRIEATSRSTVCLVEPGSCFVGFLAELMLAADRSYMLEGPRDGEENEAVVVLTAASDGPLPMANGLTRLETRFWGDEAGLETAKSMIGKSLDAAAAYDSGLVTDVMDEIDWDDELRVMLEERAGFSPDSLTGLEANLRFPGPETMETKIFGRLTAWQNWVFQRPNASGETGALRRYGTGLRPDYDQRRV
jgi:benzoyl-CoA-dihydrodiol lyase